MNQRKKKLDTPPMLVYRFILPNGKLYGQPMSDNVAFQKLQTMVNEISGVDIIPVEEIKIRNITNLMVLVGGTV